ncbi:MAG: hypothetical protein ABH821_06305 [archaeon]
MLEFFTGLFFLGLGEFVSDINLVIKILALLFIVGFARQHVGEGLLATIVIIIIAYFVLFVNWWFFGSVFIAYLLLMAGVSGILVDFFFVSSQAGGAEEMKKQQQAAMGEGQQAMANRPDVVGTDIAQRAKQTQKMKGMAMKRAAHATAKVAARVKPKPMGR